MKHIMEMKIFDRLTEAISTGISKALDGVEIFDEIDDLDSFGDEQEDSSTYTNHDKKYCKMKPFLDRHCNLANADVDDLRGLSDEDLDMLKYGVENYDTFDDTLKRYCDKRGLHVAAAKMEIMKGIEREGAILKSTKQLIYKYANDRRFAKFYKISNHNHKYYTKMLKSLKGIEWLNMIKYKHFRAYGGYFDGMVCITDSMGKTMDLQDWDKENGAEARFITIYGNNISITISKYWRKYFKEVPHEQINSYEKQKACVKDIKEHLGNIEVTARVPEKPLLELFIKYQDLINDILVYIGGEPIKEDKKIWSSTPKYYLDHDVYWFMYPSGYGYRMNWAGTYMFTLYLLPFFSLPQTFEYDDTF